MKNIQVILATLWILTLTISMVVFATPEVLVVVGIILGIAITGWALSVLFDTFV